MTIYKTDEETPEYITEGLALPVCGRARPGRLEGEPETIEARLSRELDFAEQRAWDALAHYKFQMFGYWAAIWVHLNRISGRKRPNPFAELVKAARAK